ncbi:MAG TPA: hypothetical protein VFO85_01125 [Vicinamibacteria bacterium]|nr:hypothetical protein [Vicinamibacteria bacterium]
MSAALVLDDVLPDPHAYRAQALAQEFRDVTLGPDTFRGIAPCPRGDVALAAAQAVRAEPVMSFFRKSPAGQPEPNFVHTDEMMGLWTGVYYMTPEPPEGDGTTFYERDGEGWREVARVSARFNRLVLFDSAVPHSRSLYDNYGRGDEARLIQVVFLR